MAIRKVSIKIRIKNPAGKRPYVSPVWETKGRLKPLWARIGGKAEHHPDGVYVLRYGNKWEFVGQKTDRVIARRWHSSKSLKPPLEHPKFPGRFHHSDVTIAEACQRYIIRISVERLTGPDGVYRMTLFSRRLYMARKSKLTQAAVKIGTAIGKADRTAHQLAKAGKAAKDELADIGEQINTLKRQLLKTKKRLQRALK